ERVLAQLQSLDPPGIGARNVRECLLLQLRSLEARGQPEPVAYTIVDRFLSDLGQGLYVQIARQLGLTRKEVGQAHMLIQRQLSPFPALAYVEDRPARAFDRPKSVVPDVIIRRLEGEQTRYEVEVVEEQRFSVRVDPAYIEAYQQMRGQRMGSTEEQQQIYH